MMAPGADGDAEVSGCVPSTHTRQGGPSPGALLGPSQALSSPITQQNCRAHSAHSTPAQGRQARGQRGEGKRERASHLRCVQPAWETRTDLTKKSEKSRAYNNGCGLVRKGERRETPKGVRLGGCLDGRGQTSVR